MGVFRLAASRIPCQTSARRARSGRPPLSRADVPIADYDLLKTIVGEALLLEPEHRESFLAGACGGDDSLLQEARALVGGGDAARSLFGDQLLPEGTLREALDEAESGPPVPQTLGPFRVVRRLAIGGMGAVYEAEQETPRRRVALKLLRHDVLGPGMEQRFRRETEVLGRLQHPGIAPLFEAGTVDTAEGRQPYFAMEFVEGRPLDEHANAHGLDTNARLALFARVCDAVQHAHDKGVIHRDLKPGNILVTETGEPKVLDFGLARVTDADLHELSLATEPGQIMGTLPYMSPEQVGGGAHALDLRSDVYALGVLLFELLAGRRPYEVRDVSLPEAARVIREEDATRLGTVDTTLRGDVETIVGKALEKDPARRYRSASELAHDIRRFLRHEPIGARPPSRWYLARKFVRRHRGLVAGAALAFVALGVGLGLALRFGLREAETAEQAQRAEYRARVLAAAGVLATDSRSAREFLDDTPEPLRGFEWDLLHAASRNELATFAADPRARERAEPAFASVWLASAAVDPDGRLVGALERGGAIQLVDLDRGRTLATFTDDGRLIRPLLSADASTLRAVDARDRAVFWDTRSGERLGAWPLHAPEADRDPERTLADSGIEALSPDGSRFLSEDGTAVFEEPSAYRVIEPRLGITRRLANPDFQSRHTAAGHPVAFPPDGRGVVCRDQLIDIDTGDLLEHRNYRVDELPNRTACFSRDGRLLAFGTDQGRVLVHDLASDDPPLQLVGLRQVVVGLALTHDGRSIAAASEFGELAVWDLPSGRPRLDTWVSDPTGSLALSPDGERVACATSSGLSLFATTSHSYRRLAGHESFVYCATFSPDGALLATGGWDRRVRLWDTASGEAVGSIAVGDGDAWGDGFSPRALTFSPDGRELFVDLKLTQQVFDPVTLRRRPDGLRTHPDPTFPEGEEHVREKHHLVLHGGRRLQPGQRISALNIGMSHLVGQDGERLFAADGTPLIGVQRVPGFTVEHTLGPLPAGAHALDLSPDGGTLAVGASDGSLHLLDPRTGEVLDSSDGDGHEGVVHAVAFHPSGDRLASAGLDGSVRIWRTAPLEELWSERRHENYVYTVDFSPDGTQLVAGSADGRVSLWTALPAAESHGRWVALESARDAARPLVAARLEAAGGDAQAVADALRDDADLTTDERAAALWVLREHCVAAAGVEAAVGEASPPASGR